MQWKFSCKKGDKAPVDLYISLESFQPHQLNSGVYAPALSMEGRTHGSIGTGGLRGKPAPPTGLLGHNHPGSGVGLPSLLQYS